MSVEETFELIRKYFIDKPIKKVQVFGSFARNDHDENSDIDLILTMQYPVGLFTLAGYQIDLEDILKKKIDLTTEGGVPDELYKIIKQDIRLVYERY